MSDVVVVGGGVIGLSIAYELAGQGTHVDVYDRVALGQEASWAGAGMLPPGNLEHAFTAEGRLRSLSHRLWDEWSRQLSDEVGIDNGYSRCGGIQVYLDSENACEADQTAWSQQGVKVAGSGAAHLKSLESNLSSAVCAGFSLPEMGQVRNPRHLKALISACSRRGVGLYPHCAVRAIRSTDSGVELTTDHGGCATGRVCVTAGAWTRHLLADVGTVDVVPVRGQIVLLSAGPSPIARIIQHGKRYLVPRPDGRMIVGSTEEYVGFEKRNTVTGVQELLRFAARLVPALGGAQVEKCWSGLRPQSADGLPFIGRVPGHEHLFVAAGHFRSGLQMSPGTALLARQLLLDQETEIPCSDYRCDRELAECA